MTQDERASKIIWFCLRTGAGDEEAIKWLEEAKWKIEIAIQNRNKAK